MDMGMRVRSQLCIRDRKVEPGDEGSQLPYPGHVHVAWLPQRAGDKQWWVRATVRPRGDPRKVPQGLFIARSGQCNVQGPVLHLEVKRDTSAVP